MNISRLSEKEKQNILDEYFINQAYRRGVYDYHQAMNEYLRTGGKTYTYKDISGENGKTKTIQTVSYTTPPIFMTKSNLRTIITGNKTWHPENQGYIPATRKEKLTNILTNVIYSNNDSFNLTFDKELNYPRQWLVKKLGLKHSSKLPKKNINNQHVNNISAELHQKIEDLRNKHLQEIQRILAIPDEKEQKIVLDLENYIYEEKMDSLVRKLEVWQANLARRKKRPATAFNIGVGKFGKKLTRKVTNWLTTEPAKPRQYTKEGKEIFTRNEIKKELGYDPNVSYNFQGFESVKPLDYNPEQSYFNAAQMKNMIRRHPPGSSSSRWSNATFYSEYNPGKGGTKTRKRSSKKHGQTRRR